MRLLCGIKRLDMGLLRRRTPLELQAALSAATTRRVW